MTPAPEHSPLLRAESILAIDHGERRIGLAVKPPDSDLVLPVGIIQVADEPEAVLSLLAVLRERTPTLVVVGLPVGGDMSQAARVKRFTRKLRRHHQGARWRFVDESLTSEESRRRATEAGFSTRHHDVDAGAAALILEAFLQSPAFNRSPPE